MEWVVTTGRTVDEAKDAALDELGVDEEDAEFEILEEPKPSFFGRTRGQARVRARVRPAIPRPKLDRRDRRRRGRREDVSGLAAIVEGARPAVPAETDDDRGSTVEPANGERSDGGPVEHVTDEEGVVMEEAAPQVSLDAQAEIARAFVDGLLQRFGVSADVSMDVGEDSVEVQVAGPQLGLLIGPKGQTLSAIQELTRTAVQHRVSGHTARVVVDVAGYRQRRKEALERFTRQVAQDVLATGVQKVLEPMAAPDRKIVHDTANSIPGIRTASEGEDPRRRVLIMVDAAHDPEPDPGATG
jgi:spoIIIJ-associated protein